MTGPATPSGPLALLPMQWGSLPLLEEAGALDDADLACMRELRDVLKRHGKLKRFAVHLAHRHFELGEGEILVERPDDAARTQHVTVERAADWSGAVPTTWLFDDGPEFSLGAAVYCVCATGPLSPACYAHVRSESPTRTKIEQDRLSERNYQQDKAKKEIGWPAGGHDRRIERE